MGPSSVFSKHGGLGKAVKGWWENTLPFFIPVLKEKHSFMQKSNLQSKEEK